MSDNGKRMRDAASEKMVERATAAGMVTAFDRYEGQQPQCRFGGEGICCRICNMGPCRVITTAGETRLGVCGANADTIAARNLVRMIAAGTAAHSDHGRDVAHTFLMMAGGRRRITGSRIR